MSGFDRRSFLRGTLAGAGAAAVTGLTLNADAAVPASVPFLIATFAAAYRWLDPSSGRNHGAVIARDLRPRET